MVIFQYKQEYSSCIIILLILGIDSSTLKNLAVAVTKQTHRLGDDSSSFNFGALANHLQEEYSTLVSAADGPRGQHQFDWLKFGMAIGNVFNLFPKCNTMLGRLDIEIKHRKKSESTRKSKEILVAENLEEIENKKTKSGDGESDDAEATNGRAAKLMQTLSMKCSTSSSSSNSTSMLDLLVDDEDPVQTIENLFDFSFMVKNKQVIVSDEKIPNSNKNQLRLKMEPHPESITNDDKKQMVMRFDMKDLLELQEIKRKKSEKSGAKKRELTELHRDDELYLAANAHEQADLLQRRTSLNVKERSPSPKKTKIAK